MANIDLFSAIRNAILSDDIAALNKFQGSLKDMYSRAAKISCEQLILLTLNKEQALISRDFSAEIYVPSKDRGDKGTMCNAIRMASPAEIHNNEANGSRLSRLLVNKGTQALKAALDFKHPPSTLASVLNANKKQLKKLRYKDEVINSSQWKLLYPTSGQPDTKKFDVTLLGILLRNICGLASPATGWDKLPPDSDTSVAANIARIKFYRNKVYGHVTTTEVTDNEFENLWKKISQALASLGIPKFELDELKEAPLSPDEVDYIEQLEAWHKKEVQLIEISLDTNADVKDVLAKVEKLEQRSRENEMLKVDKLGKCNFSGEIRRLNEMFLPGTRKWLFDQLDPWFSDNSDSTVMILTAGPGVGKSVFAAKVCQMYTERKQLAACHFCKYNNSDYRNPRMIISSLASNMCDSVSGFKAKLTEQLERDHSDNMLSDVFRVHLNDPLHALEEREPMLLVIDALDESSVDSRSEFLELISEEFSKLPKWIKILITSRPELPVQNELQHLNPVVIAPDDSNNEEDLLNYLRDHLSLICENDSVLKSLARECEGSFLFAYHAQMELKKTTKPLTKENLSELVPKGMSGFYKKQFLRLRDQLSSIASREFNLKGFLQVLVAAKGPLPLKLLPHCLGLPDDTEYELRRVVSDIISTILPVYDDSLIVYHKSLVDWLTSDGYEEHALTVDLHSGHEPLWRACEKVFRQIVSSTMSELKLTSLVRYALAFGISHMIKTGSQASYNWSVELKLVHARLTFVDDQYTEMLNEWLEIVKNLSLSSVFLNELRWHITLFETVLDKYETCGAYLQCIANRIEFVGNDCDKRSAARTLLKEGRYFWFEDLDSTVLTKRFSLSVRLRTDVTCIDVSANEQLLAVGYKDGWISIFKLPNFEEVHVFDTVSEPSWIRWGAFFRDKFIPQYDVSQQCIRWNREDLPSFGGYYGATWSCAFSSSGNRLVTCDGSDKIKLWDVNNGNCLQQLEAGGFVDYCYFSECGLFILANTLLDIIYSLDESIERSLEMIRLEDDDRFTAWNAITLKRVDRRHVFRKSFLDVFSLHSSHSNTQHLLPINFLNTVLTSCRHWHDCIFYHTGAKISRFDELENMQPYLADKVTGCRCLDLKATSVVPAKVRGLYMVPSFAKLNVFNVADQSSAVSFIPQLYSIQCCCFSPDGSFLAACIKGEALTVLVWDARLCRIVQVIQLPLFSASNCWWSEMFFWIYDKGLVKIPTSKGKILDPPNAQKVEIGWQPIRLLTFSDVLIFIDKKFSYRVVRIIDGEVRYVEKLPFEDSIMYAAVSPCNSVILACNEATIHICKEVQATTSLHWVALNAINVANLFSDPEECFLSWVEFSLVGECCVFGTRGVLVCQATEHDEDGSFFERFLILVDLNAGEMTGKPIAIGTLEELLYADNSFCITKDSFRDVIVARDLTSGEVIAEWWTSRDVGRTLYLFSHKGNNVAIISLKLASVMFLKLRVPEQSCTGHFEHPNMTLLFQKGI